MSFVHLLLGFSAKVITGLDDVITRIPIIASVAKTKLEKFVFALSMLAGISLAVLLAEIFSIFITKFPYHKYITSSLLIFFALGIYFNWFVHKPKEKTQESMIEKTADLDYNNILKIFGIGFVSTIATILDDIVVFLPLLGSGATNSLFAIIGILIASIIEIIIVIYFSHYLMRIKHKEKIASLGLLILAVLILLGVI